MVLLIASLLRPALQEDEKDNESNDVVVDDDDNVDTKNDESVIVVTVGSLIKFALSSGSIVYCVFLRRDNKFENKR